MVGDDKYKGKGGKGREGNGGKGNGGKGKERGTPPYFVQGPEFLVTPLLRTMFGKLASSSSSFIVIIIRLIKTC